MALPVGVTTALAHIDAPVSFGGTPAKVYLEIVPNIRLNHIATGTPLANFIDVRTPGLGDPATVTLPHTDQAGFQDESGLPVVNWSYAATIRYELDGQLIHVPVKHFQILTGQTDVDLALIPVGEPTEIILGNVAFVSSLNGRSGAVTLTSGDLGDPIELTTENLNTILTTRDYVQSQSGEATTANNYPADAKPGFLRSRRGTNGIVAHEYTTTDDMIYIRRWNGTTWTAWSQIASFADPNADRIAFWDDSASTFMPLTISSPLAISGTTMSISAATESLSGRVELATAAETATGSDTTRAVHPAGLKPLLDAKNDVVALGYRAKTSTAAITDYPLGVSVFLASTADGFVFADGEGFKNIHTVRSNFGTATGSQWAYSYADNTRPPHFRTWDNDDSAWGPWYIMASRNYVDAQITTSEGTTNAALATKAPIASPTFTGTVSGVSKSMVGLGNVDNTSDAAKPVSTAQQTALNLKANLASPAFTGTPTGITKAHVGLGNVDNTADSAKPVSTAQQTALDLKADAAATATALGTKADATATTNALALKENTLKSVNTRTATPYNIAASDEIVVANLGTAIAFSLPDPTGIAGKNYWIKNIGVGTLTVNSLGTSKTIDGAANFTLATNTRAQVFSNGTQWYRID